MFNSLVSIFKIPSLFVFFCYVSIFIVLTLYVFFAYVSIFKALSLYVQQFSFFLYFCRLTIQHIYVSVKMSNFLGKDVLYVAQKIPFERYQKLMFRNLFRERQFLVKCIYYKICYFVILFLHERLTYYIKYFTEKVLLLMLAKNRNKRFQYVFCTSL